MNLQSKTGLLQEIFTKVYGLVAENIVALPRSGSYREYYRIYSGDKTAIGVYNADRKENEAFIRFTRHFLSIGLPVPGILSEDLDKNIYLLTDLGDTTLFSYILDNRENGDFPEVVQNVYKQIVEQLPLFQVNGNKGLDYAYCYPRARFDKQSMMWDLSYFKYYFLKLAKIPFDEQDLENDFHAFTNHLLEEDNDFFMYRDFQSSNIMLNNDKLFFIDYQGGRKGALQYDLASLLFDAKADVPKAFKESLMEHYVEQLGRWFPFDEKKFRKYYYSFALVRLMQAMGAFGFRGFYEKKPQFLRSIPYAMKTMEYLLGRQPSSSSFPYLLRVLHSMIDSPELKQFSESQILPGSLLVEINSFSYRRGIPLDMSDNGGGFVFDCRAIHNPGRYEDYKDLNGLDAPVIEFLQKNSQADRFMDDVFNVVGHSVKVYIERGYTRLMVNFGCTGGQHRSVYCAEELKKRIEKTFGQTVRVHLNHREQEYRKLGI